MNNMFNMHVLITNSHNYEDQFNIVYQISESKKQLFIKRSINIDQTQQNNTDPKKYFMELSNINNSALSGIHQSINDKVFIILPLKNLQIKIDEIRSMEKPNNYEIEKSSLLEDLISFCQLCEMCGNPYPNFLNKIGCYFHEECLENIFKE